MTTNTLASTDDFFGSELAGAEEITYTFNTSSAMLEAIQEFEYSADPYGKLRFCKPGSSAPLQWTQPNAGKEKTIEIPVEAQTVMGIRGIPVHIRAGLGLYSSEKEMMKCTTVSSTVKDSKGNSFTYSDQKPVSKLVYGPVQYETENDPVPELMRYGLVGSQEYGLKCHDCVLSGKNFLEYKNASGKIERDSCGGSIQVLFVVSEFFCKVTDWETNTSTTTWVNWKDMKVHPKSAETLYKNPPVIDFNLSRSIASKSVANQGLKLESHVPANSNSWNYFYSQMLKENRIQSMGEGGFRQIVYGVVEMHNIALGAAASTETIKAIPVFSLVNDRPYASTAEKLAKTVSYSITAFAHEFTASGGSFAEDTVTPITSGQTGDFRLPGLGDATVLEPTEASNTGTKQLAAAPDQSKPKAESPAVTVSAVTVEEVEEDDEDESVFD